MAFRDPIKTYGHDFDGFLIKDDRGIKYSEFSNGVPKYKYVCTCKSCGKKFKLRDRILREYINSETSLKCPNCEVDFKFIKANHIPIKIDRSLIHHKFDTPTTWGSSK